MLRRFAYWNYETKYYRIDEHRKLSSDLLHNAFGMLAEADVQKCVPTLQGDLGSPQQSLSKRDLFRVLVLLNNKRSWWPELDLKASKQFFPTKRDKEKQKQKDFVSQGNQSAAVGSDRWFFVFAIS